MRPIPATRPYHARREKSVLGKIAATIASLVTIAILIFIGSRDWKSNAAVTTALHEISALKDVFAKVENSGSATAEKNAAASHAKNDVERALIEKGTLVRSNTLASGDPLAAPLGLSRTVSGH